MINEKTTRITLTALFTALICVATSVIRISIPATGGYIHFGDGFAVAASFVLGPIYGAIAASFGAAVSDILGGYVIYVPGTIIIKALCVLASSLFVKYVMKNVKSDFLKYFVSATIFGIINVFGYFIYEFAIFGPAAFAACLGTTIQSVFGVVVACVILPVIKKVISYHLMLRHM